LSFLSNTYKDIFNYIIDAEKLLEIFKRKLSICNKDDAKPLELNKVEAKLNNVSFAYSS
jgi:ABC-type transport system involved in Fe-S cluster assembly fused permease/ATPase subunit